MFRIVKFTLHETPSKCLRDGSHGFDGEGVTRLCQHDDRMQEEVLLARSIGDLPHHQPFHFAVICGLFLGILRQLALAAGGNRGSVEADHHLLTPQFGREVGSHLQHHIQLVLGELLHAGLHHDGRVEAKGRAVVHEGELAFGTRQAQTAGGLEGLHVHGGVEVHVVHVHRAGSFGRLVSFHDGGVELNVEAGMAIQLVLALDSSFNGAVNHL